MADPIPALLQQAVAKHVLPVGAAVLSPVMSVSLGPLLLAAALVVLIIGIGFHLFALPQGFPGALAYRTAAVSLVLHPGVRTKQTFAMGHSESTCSWSSSVGDHKPI